MFDWQAIGTHAVEMLLGGVGTWLFSNLRTCQHDVNAAFQKIRDLERQVLEIEEALYAGDPDDAPRGRQAHPGV